MGRCCVYGTLGYRCTIFQVLEKIVSARYVSLKLLYLAHYDKGLGKTFARETTFRCSSTSRRTGAASTSRSRMVDLRSDRPAGVYETIRHGRDAFIYPHRGSRHSPSAAAHQQNTGFCSASRTTGVRIQQGSECLAEFAFRNAFRQQQLKCLAPIHRHGFAMHLEGDRRTCACGYSAGAGRSTCVQTALPGAYETIRHGRDAS